MDLIFWVQNAFKDLEETMQILSQLCYVLDSETLTTPSSTTAFEKMLLENMRKTIKCIERSRTSEPDFVSNTELREILTTVYVTVAAAAEFVQTRHSKLTEFAQPQLPFFTIASIQIAIYALQRLKQRLERYTKSDTLDKNGELALKVLAFALVRGSHAKKEN